MTKFSRPLLFALPALALVAVASLAVGGIDGRRSQASTCGPAIAVQDPDLRAAFARFDRHQSAAAQKVCAIYRERR
jgi:hypothetical protein